MSDVGSQSDRSASDAETVADRPPTAPDEHEPRARADGDIGRYVVLELAGSGGMGRVLRAYDPKLQREVAVKELRSNALGTEGRQRLILEARAMAKLSHPNVVAVYDVEEVDDGRLILAMEYVPGQTLREWLLEHRRSVTAVLDRFLAAGRGLVAAHEAGLLHRDFKPANVLCTADAEAGRRMVKVTDFGLAKADACVASSHGAREHGSADSEGLTHVGSVMGTPRYMAPEQHGGRELSPAADQYAFCVALWEALCGTPPFSGKDLARKKRKGPPPWPESGVPGRVIQAIERGLAPTESQRWPSLRALLDELDDDPARRRNRWLYAAGGLGMLGVGVAAWASASSSAARRCSGAAAAIADVWNDERRDAVRVAMVALEANYVKQAWERTQAALDRYTDDWVAMHTEACEATAIRGEQSSEVMDLRMACLQRASVGLRAAIDLLTEADAETVRRAHKVIADLPELSRCEDVAALKADVDPPASDEAAAVDEIRILLAGATAMRAAGQYEPAQTRVHEAQKLAEPLRYGPIRSDITLALATGSKLLGDYEAAEAAYREALQQASRWQQWPSMHEAATSLMYLVGHHRGQFEHALRYRELAEGLAEGNLSWELTTRTTLGALAQDQGHYEEAETHYRAVLAGWEAVHGPDHRYITTAVSNLSSVLTELGKYDEAEAGFRRVLDSRQRTLGAEHPDIARTHNAVAAVAEAQGNFVESEAESRIALELWENALGPDHPMVSVALNTLGNALQLQGKYGEAVVAHRRSLELKREGLGPDHPNVGIAEHNIAAALNKQGKYDEAVAGYRRALEIFERALGPDHSHVAASRINLSSTLRNQGNPAQAEVEARRAWQIYEKAFGPEHPDVALARDNLAQSLQEQGRLDEAEAEFRHALRLRETLLGAEHPDLALNQLSLGLLLLDRGQHEEASALAELAWERLQRDDIPTGSRAASAFLLARTQWESSTDAKSRAGARSLAQRSLRDYAEVEGRNDETRQIKAWLAAH